MRSVHPLIQSARGYLEDEDYDDVRVVLSRAVDVAKDVEEERDRLRDALEQIDHELGGPNPSYPSPMFNAAEIARAALNPGEKP